jgi:hypothetical protein
LRRKREQYQINKQILDKAIPDVDRIEQVSNLSNSIMMLYADDIIIEFDNLDGFRKWDHDR